MAPTYGAPGEEKMKLLETAVTGVTGTAQGSTQPCETCILSKSVRTVNRDAPERTTKRLERVYTDFWGPFATPTPSGAMYILTFTDDYTRKSWVYLTKTRIKLYKKFNK